MHSELGATTAQMHACLCRKSSLDPRVGAIYAGRWICHAAVVEPTCLNPGLCPSHKTAAGVTEESASGHRVWRSTYAWVLIAHTRTRAHAAKSKKDWRLTRTLTRPVLQTGGLGRRAWCTGGQTRSEVASPARRLPFHDCLRRLALVVLQQGAAVSAARKAGAASAE